MRFRRWCHFSASWGHAADISPLPPPAAIFASSFRLFSPLLMPVSRFFDYAARFSLSISSRQISPFSQVCFSAI
jgi:hypothetical protein